MRGLLAGSLIALSADFAAADGEPGGEPPASNAPVPPPGATAPATTEESTEPAAWTARPEHPDQASQVGEASWYGPGFHGRLTANGEFFDQEGLTAAHRWLPFGTQIVVTNLDNGCSVTLRVTDRGPFHGERILDCSKAAAEELGFIDRGVARIRWDVLRWPPRKRGSLRLGTGPTFSSSDKPLLKPPRAHEPLPPIALEY